MTSADLFRRTPFAAPMDALPLSCLDVGSRGGIEPDLLPIAFAVDAVGFEADAAECDRLNKADSSPWRRTRFIPAALSGRGGRTTLHIAEDPVSSSLLPPVAETGKRFGKTGYASIIGTAEVETYGLDEATGTFGLPAFDFIKLDTEGIELDILRSGAQAVSHAAGIKVEVSFMTFREGQPLAREVDAFLSDRGFELVALITPSHWRIQGHTIHPRLADQPIPYSRGQLAHGDFLYLRHPDRMDLDGMEENGNAERRIRAAWIAMAYGYFDRAAEYLADPTVRKMIEARWGIDVGRALRQSSLLYGRAVWRTEFAAQLRGLIPFVRDSYAALFRR